MVPSPSPYHQRFERKLANVLEQFAVPRGLAVYHEVDLHNPKVSGREDYRAPDVVVVEERHVSKRGIEGDAHIAIEIRSPEDESYEKLPFYAKVGVREVWIIDQAAKTIEVYVGERQVAAVGGVVHAPALGLELSISGNRLKLKDGTAELEVDLG
jgi:Uma2 family endonuclease